jgi:hypothetical protein
VKQAEIIHSESLEKLINSDFGEMSTLELCEVFVILGADDETLSNDSFTLFHLETQLKEAFIK